MIWAYTLSMKNLNEDQRLLVQLIQEDLDELYHLEKMLKRSQMSSPKKAREWSDDIILLEFRIKDWVRSLGITVLADHLQAIWDSERNTVVIKDREIRYNPND